MRPRKDFMEGLKRKALKTWKLDSQWRITYEFVDEVLVEGSPCPMAVDVALTEKAIHVQIEKSYYNLPRKRLRYDFVHEVGHTLTWTLYRVVTAFLEQHRILMPGTALRSAFDEVWNLEDNRILDHVLTQIIGMSGGPPYPLTANKAE